MKMSPSLVWFELLCLCTHLASAGWYNLWTRQTTNLLVEKVLQEDVFDLFEGLFVDVWIAFGTDLPKFGTITCSWQVVRKRYQRTAAGKRFAGYEINHWYMVQILGKKFKFSDGWMSMVVKPNHIINTQGWKFGLPKENNVYPLYIDREEQVIAYVVRNVAQIKSLSRLTKRYYTFITVKLDMFYPRLSQRTWNSVLRAKRRLKSLGLPVILNNRHFYKDFCWDSSYE